MERGELIKVRGTSFGVPIRRARMHARRGDRRSRERHLKEAPREALYQSCVEIKWRGGLNEWWDLQR